ncbi:MAG: hypothetical protein HKN94_00890 [Acidimicrobiales bacterium]|nr:hypothetical protein [Acidimicrobiales bacterium]RZV47793.1 MAG: hypothetical protein EX269_04075 [Acidimicrobiales bacterium]
MLAKLRPVATRLVRILGPDPAAVGQSLVALAISIAATLAAGLTLASAEGRLSELPGLLLLVPAAIAQRGNVFGAMGSRLGTSIHTGTFRISARPDTLFGQNVIAGIGLSWVAAVWLAAVAKLLAIMFGVADSMSLLDFVAVSVVGGMIASLLVLAITVALAAGSSRWGWDLDNVTAPLVTATGDLVTLPALLIGSAVVAANVASEIIGLLSIAVALVILFMVLRSSLPILHRIVIESLPVLAVASSISLVAGIVVEKRLQSFLDEPALLVLVPAYFGMAGALGGILSSRLGTKIHLGLITPSAIPSKVAWEDIRSVVALSLPIFGLVGLFSHLGAVVFGTASPGVWSMVGVAMLGGIAAIIVVVAVAYYGTLAAVRSGIDPDTAGIPLTNSVLDLVGAFTLVAAILLLGVA